MSVLHPLHTDLERPRLFTWPFNYEPHPLSLLAARALQQHLATMVLTEGKMFGVLVVETAEGQLAFLAAYSGLLEGRNDWPYFVPPVFDAQQPDGHFKQEERLISAMRETWQHNERKQRSQQLQRWLFDQYHLWNGQGEQRHLVAIWQDYHTSERLRNRFPLPPGGTGDCCAPKLLQYAYQQRFKPLCMAEFWWGPSPKTEIRRHGQFYPACSGKCKPVLTWMLKGLVVEPDPDTVRESLRQDITIVYEDEAIIVVNKPPGMLSVPGRIGSYSVATILSNRYPGALLAHRLDMGTSGLLVAGRNRDIYRQLQQQFAEHTVSKSYVALLEDDVPGHITPQRGTISLPLAADMLNRPRQVVDYEHGKTAVTDYEMIGDHAVRLYPHTGRTHQLRMHCAHPDGLGRAIRGDELYGHAADRLYLHAERLELTHPLTGQRMVFTTPPNPPEGGPWARE